MPVASTLSVIDQPFEEAIRFLRDKANVTTKKWTDVYAAAHSRAFMVAGAASNALVADFRREVAKALEQGTTLDEFRKGFDDIVKRHGWSHVGSRNWRSRIIFETNLRTAYAAGRYAQLTEPETLEAFPYWQYNHSGALHPRREHLSWDGLVLPTNDPFWTTNYPPNGWRCGCFVIPVSYRDLRRQGKRGPDAAPELLFRAEEVGGRNVRVPMGVDPGFEYNPGRAWRSRTMPGSQTVAAAPGMIHRFFEGAVGGKHLDRSYIPVALAPKPVADAFGLAAGVEVRLSASTIRRHMHHPEATGEIYGALIEQAMETGDLYRDGHRLTLIMEREGAPWLAGLKRTSNGEIYLSTLHRSKADQIRKVRRVSTLVREGKRGGGS